MVAQKKSSLATLESEPVPAKRAIGVSGELPIPDNRWKRERWIYYGTAVLWGVVAILAFVVALT